MSNSKDLKQAAHDAVSVVKLETTEQYATRLLKDGAFAMTQKRSNPTVYEAARRDQVRLGLRDENKHDQLKGVRKAWDAQANPPSLTSKQIDAVALFPLEKINSLSG